MAKKNKKKEVVYDVESIEKKRIVGEEVEYLVKWVGYDSEQNTWEPLSNLNCPQMIEEYEKKHSGEDVERVEMDIESQNGFEQSWTPIKVFGATKRDSDGKLMVMVKWKGNRSSFEYADIANKLIPEMVIAYYEQRVRWLTDECDNKNTAKPSRALDATPVNT